VSGTPGLRPRTPRGALRIAPAPSASDPENCGSSAATKPCRTTAFSPPRRSVQRTATVVALVPTKAAASTLRSIR
jgi:hypothetical protein